MRLSRRTSSAAVTTASRSAGPYCSHCARSLAGHDAYILCAAPECMSLPLCVDCFSVGAANVAPHRVDHPYRVEERVEMPVYAEEWTAHEEARFLHALMEHGPCHWKEVADYVRSKSFRKCEAHYLDVYLGGKNAPLPDDDALEIEAERNREALQAPAAGIPIKEDGGAGGSIGMSKSGKTGKIGKSRKSGKLGRVGKNGKASKVGQATGDGKGGAGSNTEMVNDGISADGEEVGGDGRTVRNSSANKPTGSLEGFMPLRGDFDVEWDDNAEILIADLTIGTEDTAEERELKARLLEMYDNRLRRRDGVKEFLFANGLLDFTKLKGPDRRATRDEKELAARLEVFKRHLQPADFAAFRSSVLTEYKLSKSLYKSSQCRGAGVRHQSEMDIYELERKIRANRLAEMHKASANALSGRVSTSPVDTNGTVDGDEGKLERAKMSLSPSSNRVSHPTPSPSPSAGPNTLPVLSAGQETIRTASPTKQLEGKIDGKTGSAFPVILSGSAQTTSNPIPGALPGESKTATQRKIREQKRIMRSPYPQLQAMPVNHLEDAAKLTKAEKKVCSCLGIVPKDFLRMRDAMLASATEETRRTRRSGSKDRDGDSTFALTLRTSRALANGNTNRVDGLHDGRQRVNISRRPVTRSARAETSSSSGLYEPVGPLVHRVRMRKAAQGPGGLSGNPAPCGEHRDIVTVGVQVERVPESNYSAEVNGSTFEERQPNQTSRGTGTNSTGARPEGENGVFSIPRSVDVEPVGYARLGVSGAAAEICEKTTRKEEAMDGSCVKMDKNDIGAGGVDNVDKRPVEQHDFSASLPDGKIMDLPNTASCVAIVRNNETQRIAVDEIVTHQSGEQRRTEVATDTAQVDQSVVEPAGGDKRDIFDEVTGVANLNADQQKSVGLGAGSKPSPLGVESTSNLPCGKDPSNIARGCEAEISGNVDMHESHEARAPSEDRKGKTGQTISGVSIIVPNGLPVANVNLAANATVVVLADQIKSDRTSSLQGILPTMKEYRDNTEGRHAARVGSPEQAEQDLVDLTNEPSENEVQADTDIVDATSTRRHGVTRRRSSRNRPVSTVARDTSAEKSGVVSTLKHDRQALRRAAATTSSADNSASNDAIKPESEAPAEPESKRTEQQCRLRKKERSRAGLADAPAAIESTRCRDGVESSITEQHVNDGTRVEHEKPAINQGVRRHSQKYDEESADEELIDEGQGNISPSDSADMGYHEDSRDYLDIPRTNPTAQPQNASQEPSEAVAIRGRRRMSQSRRPRVIEDEGLENQPMPSSPNSSDSAQSSGSSESLESSRSSESSVSDGESEDAFVLNNEEVDGSSSGEEQMTRKGRVAVAPTPTRKSSRIRKPNIRLLDSRDIKAAREKKRAKTRLNKVPRALARLRDDVVDGGEDAEEDETRPNRSSSKRSSFAAGVSSRNRKRAISDVAAPAETLTRAKSSRYKLRQRSRN